MQSILVPSRPAVKPAPSIVMSDAEFSAWCAGQCESLDSPASTESITLSTAEPTDAYALSGAWWAGFGSGADGEPANVPPDYSPELAAAFLAGHWSGRDNHETELLSAAAAAGEFDPTTEDAAEWLGWRLGSDGVVAELPTPDADERAAFERGHDAGDTHLWTVDPAFASHLKERAERADADEAPMALNPRHDWHDNELIESAGRTATDCRDLDYRYEMEQRDVEALNREVFYGRWVG